MGIDYERIALVFLGSVMLGAIIKATISFPDTWEVATIVISEIRKTLRDK